MGLLDRAPVFTPHVGDFMRGMLVSIPLHTGQLPGRVTGEALRAAYAEHYANEPFITVRPLNDSSALRDGSYLEPEALNDTNRLEVFVFANDANEQALLVARPRQPGQGCERGGGAKHELDVRVAGAGRARLNSTTLSASEPVALEATVTPSLLAVEHVTTYRYRRPVRFGQHRLMFRPREGHDVQVIEAGVDVNVPSRIDWMLDTQSNSVTLVVPQSESAELKIECHFKIEQHPVRSPQDCRWLRTPSAGRSITRPRSGAISARCSSRIIWTLTGGCTNGCARSSRTRRGLIPRNC